MEIHIDCHGNMQTPWRAARGPAVADFIKYANRRSLGPESLKNRVVTRVCQISCGR